MIQPLQLNPAQAVNKLLETAKPQQQATPAESMNSFGQYLENALNSVDAQEKEVHKLNDKYLIGEVDVSQVLIATQKAELSLQLTTQIRNKVIDAYQEIMRMSV
ncbi:MULTISPECIES: flagellar hook-basal body complex protein FliE [unclassified Paenibacillus]|uniref:flagellar hook-basal body complex protein FliE n=1 Tax=unclassified Paenibacillus TaxID=185978 RepID=UPI001044D8EE|nr:MULTISPECIES: flagellar hook-basal body complex protein FliE [unclassified Paenibacillus]NIK68824.1 flagellar hook-basal body complex protein FliE [Paenibacillus sp. BK720]TCM98903.1 flagellar hook-basal body complex protein FliE [Paenibacillus sp. BK033]